MDNFKSVYKILTALEKAMDLSEFDISQVGPEALGVTQEHWNRYIEENARKTHGKALCDCMVLFSYPKGGTKWTNAINITTRTPQGPGWETARSGPRAVFPVDAFSLHSDFFFPFPVKQAII